MSADEELLEEIAAQVRECVRCGLSCARTQAVPGEGPAHAEIMLVGEGPGEAEDRQGRPFVGPAGQLLNSLLLEAGLRRPDVFIANIVKCRPPGNREPLPQEVVACHEYLDGQIAIIQPQVVCLLGAVATKARLDPTASISRLHGRAIERDGMVYVPLYHPAAALHRAALRPVLVEDMVRLKGMLKRIRD